MNYKHILASVALSIALHSTSVAQTPPAADGFLSLQTEIIPFIGELGTIKFKADDKAIPNEIIATVSARQIQFNGTKKGHDARVMGRVTGWHGKAVLISAPIPQSGTLIAKIPTLNEATSYGLVLEFKNGTLKWNGIPIEANLNYDWSAKAENGSFVVEVTKEGKFVDAIRAVAKDVKTFGFYSTVRYHGSKADLTVNVPRRQK